MKKKIFNYLLFLLFVSPSFAQDLDLNWSDPKVYSKKIDGFHKYFIGTSDSYIYSYSGPYLKSNTKAIICHNKATMEQVRKLELCGFDDDARNEKLDDKDYFKTIIIDNKLHIFWVSQDKKKSKNGTREIFVETYDENLKNIDKLHKLISHTGDDIGALTILSSAGNNATQKKNGVVILNQTFNSTSEQSKIHLIHFDSDLEEISNENIKFSVPVAEVSRKGSAGSTYYTTGYFGFAEDGNIYKNTTAQEILKKGLFSRSYKFFSVITAINVKNSEINVTEFKNDSKDIYSLRIVSRGNDNYIMGFFRDLKKEPTGSRTHGVFSSKIDISTGEFGEETFTYFSKQVLDKLFKEDGNDHKESTKLTKRGREKEDAKNEDAISYNYIIEQTGITSKGELLLVCSSMYNYSVTTCTTDSKGSTICTTRDYCNKQNVTVFALDAQGEITWCKNIDRNITYSGTSIYDVKMAEKNGKFYVVFGGNNTMDLEGLSKREKRALADRTDNFSYAILDPIDQSMEPKTFKIEQASEKKADQRYIKPESISVFDNAFYTNSEVSRPKVGPVVGLCTAALVCPPVLMFYFISKEAFQKTTGQLGVIEPID
jgi:hypothetical protein